MARQANQTLTRRRRSRAFTLLELLISVAIVALLVAIIGAALAKVRAAGRNVLCMNNLRVVASEFFQFADDYAHAGRGDSDRYDTKSFYIEDFQDKVYRVDEFWEGGSAGQVSYRPQDQPMICPAGPAQLYKQRGFPCNQGAVGPTANVSIGFNMRLERVSQVEQNWARLVWTRLTSKILDHPNVPLVFDVDGARADSIGVTPYCSAPPAGDTGMYGSGMFWFPSLRHGGRMNAAFVGGHVLRSDRPDKAPQWKWEYQPPLR